MNYLLETNYNGGARGVAAYNGGGPFLQADAATRIRGVSSIGVVGFAMISTASWVDGVDATRPLLFMAFWGVVWICTCPWVNKIEPIANVALVELQGR